MAVLSTRSGQVARSLNSGRDRFHIVPYKEVISGQAEPFLSRAWGRPAAVAVYQSRWQLYQGRPAYGRFIKNGRCVKIEDQASGRNGRFVNQKRANGQICRFGLRMVDFILPRTSSLSTARSSLFRKSWQSSGRFIRPASRNGRFIKASLFESFLQAPHKASSKFSSKAPRKASCSFFASCAAPLESTL